MKFVAIDDVQKCSEFIAQLNIFFASCKAKGMAQLEWRRNKSSTWFCGVWLLNVWFLFGLLKNDTRQGFKNVWGCFQISSWLMNNARSVKWKVLQKSQTSLIEMVDGYQTRWLGFLLIKITRSNQGNKIRLITWFEGQFTKYFY